MAAVADFATTTGTDADTANRMESSWSKLNGTMLDSDTKVFPRTICCYDSPVQPVQHVDLFEPAKTAFLCGRYFLNILSCIKTPVIRFICMLGIFIVLFLTYAVIYVYMYPDGFSETLWYV